MSIGIFTHPACLAHTVPEGHPERQARLSAVLKGLKTEEFQYLKWIHASTVSHESLAATHSSGLVDSVLGQFAREAQVHGWVQIDADTGMSSGSAEAALRAAGALTQAVDLVVKGEIGAAFCAVRPPGHHATRDRAMGFCLFNNVAIGALHARNAHGLKRIAVVDFDVHHGNGTEDIFWNDPNLFYASTHQSPLYPGTGARSEQGVANNILNVPLAPFAGGKEFRDAFTREILPALEKFAPEFLFISAGFDAHKADPLAQLNLDEEDFGWATRELCAVAKRVCGGRVVSTLEGGYDLDALARSAQAHVRALMEA